MNLIDFENKIFKIKTESEFESCALSLFKFQYSNNPVFRNFCELIRKHPDNVRKLIEIPFLPIQFFKSQIIKSTEFEEATTFISSGTSGTQTSKHYLKSTALYTNSFLSAFNTFYPKWKDSAIIGLLPSYLERTGSSLIYMVDHLIRNSANPKSGFHLKPDETLIEYLSNDEEPKILFGVTFALLELCQTGLELKNTIIIETGGMKGRGKELTREELHQVIKQSLKPKSIHSEYGMTELLSQAYFQNNRFESPNWMRVLVREAADPLTVKKDGKGVLNVIDLANIYSCAFIATDDLGICYNDKSFLVQGRIDHAQIRGCNLLVGDY